VSSATVTSKGQITIPADVRARLGLRPGSRLAFVPTAAGGYEIHPEAGSIKDLKGAVPWPSRPVSVEEMAEAIADAAIATVR
jgi:AbrB family looped-hinge helix DNA binding protein